LKAIILGAAGQVGRALAETAPAGVTVMSWDRSNLDLTNLSVLRERIMEAQPDLIFNAAAYTAVDLAEREVELAQRVNGEAPGAIAQAAVRVGAKLVHISTDFVFDGLASTPRTPSDPVGPLSVYGKSKLAGEISVQTDAPDSLIVRTAWVYDPTGRNFVNTMLRLMRERDRISVVADQIGTPTYAPSLAQALWLLAHKGLKGILHYTDAGTASWYDFAVAIAEEGYAAGLLNSPLLVAPIGTRDYPTPAPRPMFSVLDKTATYDILGGPAPHWRVNLRSNIAKLAEHL
jgi:dTDP-4-dehydrorhamnose reductase